MKRTYHKHGKKIEKAGSAMAVILNFGKQTFNLPHVSPLQPITLRMATSTSMEMSHLHQAKTIMI